MDGLGITLAEELLIPKTMNPSGMDMIISKGARIAMTEKGNVVIYLENGSLSPQSDLEFSKIIWEKALEQALNKALGK